MAFDRSSISRSRQFQAPKLLLTGLPKVGKSTFASQSPSPVFIPIEDGISGIDVDAFPLAQSLDDVYSAISTLLNEEHEFKTVVIDSADWLSPLIEGHVCAENKWESIESPGYGRGHAAAATEWRTLLNGLEALRLKRHMGVIIICHVKLQRIETPTHEGYDAWVLKTHSKAAALLEEWSDIIGFAAPKIAIKKTDAGFGQKESKAIKTNERILHLDPHPAYPSGSRFGLNDCPLSWQAFADQFFAALTAPQS